MKAEKKAGITIQMPNMQIKPKDLYHMIFYAALTIMTTILAAGPPSDDIVILVIRQLPCGILAVYALFKMHGIIEAA